jgi:hypothetical protein
MTGPKLITGLAILMLAGWSLSWILQGTWIDASHHSALNSLAALKTYNVLGLFKIPWVNVDFFLTLPKLLTFDFSFFGGNYGYFRYLFYVWSIGAVWGIVGVVIGVMVNFFGRR